MWRVGTTAAGFVVLVLAVAAATLLRRAAQHTGLVDTLYTTRLADLGFETAVPSHPRSNVREIDPVVPVSRPAARSCCEPRPGTFRPRAL